MPKVFNQLKIRCDWKNHLADIGYKLKWIKDVYQLHEPYKYKILLDGYTCICYINKWNHFQEYNTCS